MNVKYNMVVDFARPSKSNTIILSEGDANSRVCCFTLLFNKQAFGMIDVTVATVKAVKQNGSVVYGDAEITTDENGNKINEVIYTIPAAITDEAGKVTMTITLMSSQGEQITSFEFYLTVRNALYNEDDYISEEDLSGFRDLLNRAMAALEKMEVMTSQEALPNPYPFVFEVEGNKHSYTGNSAVTVALGNMVYLNENEEVEVEESVEESAAAKAAASATAAAQSALVASRAAVQAEENLNKIGESVAKAEEYKNLAYGYRGEAAASAALALQVTSEFAAEIESIKQAIRDLGGNI